MFKNSTSLPDCAEKGAREKVNIKEVVENISYSQSYKLVMCFGSLTCFIRDIRLNPTAHQEERGSTH